MSTIGFYVKTNAMVQGFIFVCHIILHFGFAYVCKRDEFLSYDITDVQESVAYKTVACLRMYTHIHEWDTFWHPQSWKFYPC